jgi:hypothetical protein
MTSGLDERKKVASWQNGYRRAKGHYTVDLINIGIIEGNAAVGPVRAEGTLRGRFSIEDPSVNAHRSAEPGFPWRRLSVFDRFFDLTIFAG